jgi:hypothetical protein
MIPGSTTKLSETTALFNAVLDVKSDILLVNGAGTITTLRPYFGGGQSGQLILVPVTAGVILGTTGNILVGITCAINRPVWLVYCKSLGKWLINSGV